MMRILLTSCVADLEFEHLVTNTKPTRDTYHESGTGYASRDADRRPGCAERPGMLARRPRTQRPRTRRGVPKRETRPGTWDAENRPRTHVIIVRAETVEMRCVACGCVLRHAGALVGEIRQIRLPDFHDHIPNFSVKP